MLNKPWGVVWQWQYNLVKEKGEHNLIIRGVRREKMSRGLNS